MYIPLHNDWTVTALNGPVPENVIGVEIPASVPGCVTTDLLEAGLVPDPYLDRNEELLGWVGRSDWCYRTSFRASPLAPGEHCDLVCEGLDTVATVRLNGTVLGHTANMHRSYRFDARPALVEGTNRLEVEFKAPVVAAEQMSQEIGPRPHVETHPFNAIRKMACNYGWDWGPDLATSGIWRPIGLHRWRRARVAAVRPLVSVDVPGAAREQPGAEAPWADDSLPRNADGAVEVHVDVEQAGSDGAEAGDLELSVTVAGRRASLPLRPGETKATLSLAVPQASLWWPAGYGEQPLYELEVSLHQAGDATAPLDVWGGRIGFRSVSIDTGEDGRGKRLGFVVNGRSVLVRGANWIPDDCFPGRVDADRYRRRLAAARAANINLLRVWGGGIYETDDFYQVADELGLLVWQDFALACAAYPEEEPLRSEIEAEAREAVTRLSRHPSLAAWSGGNENIWGHADWGWETELQGKTWGAAYYFEIFPAIVSELDPTRPYMAGSPWSFSHDAHPNDENFGSMHVWDVWNSKDYSAYRQHRPQFVAEFGFQGPPAWSTLARAVTERPLSTAAPGIAAHQKAAGGNEKLAQWLAPRWPQPRSFDDWHWATSLNQARAVTLAIEYWRALTPRCRGMVLWQLNDCWPVMSWAVIDGDERLKPVWYALRRAYADRALTIQPTSALAGLPPGPQPSQGPGGQRESDTTETAELSLVAMNDGLAPWDLELELTRQSFAGEVLAKGALTLSAAPGRSTAVAIDKDVATPGDPRREVLVAFGAGVRALWFYREDKDLALPVPDLEARAERTTDGFDVTLTASTLQRDVALLADKVDPAAVCDDMVFTLLPGETRQAHVRTAVISDGTLLTRPEVLRSANQLCHPA